MARQEEVPPLERAIGARLRQFREGKLISRTAFALSVGIGYQRLESYEAGRVPLPYGVFKAINAKYFLSAEWLVTGHGSVVWAAPFDVTKIKDEPGERERLSVAFEDALGDAYYEEARNAVDAIYGPNGFLSVGTEFISRFRDPVERKNIPASVVGEVRAHLQAWIDALKGNAAAEETAKREPAKKNRPSRRRRA